MRHTGCMFHDRSIKAKEDKGTAPRRKLFSLLRGDPFDEAAVTGREVAYITASDAQALRDAAAASLGYTRPDETLNLRFRPKAKARLTRLLRGARET